MYLYSGQDEKRVLSEGRALVAARYGWPQGHAPPIAKLRFSN